MRKLALAAILSLVLSACNTTGQGGAAVGTLSGLGGAAIAPTIAKSKTATTALSIACANSAPILDRYGAKAWPAAAPFIPAAEAAFASLCHGALPAGTSTTKAAATVNTLFAIVLGTGLMD